MSSEAQEQQPDVLEGKAVGGENLKPESTSVAPLSQAICDFLKKQSIDPASLRSAEYIHKYKCDTSHPINQYYISSSHNTYLSSNQLTGAASPDRYRDVLTHGVRCVEIDAWDNDENPNCPVKVTHGWTLTDHLLFDQVCEAIVTADDQDQTPYPIIVSLENHASRKNQLYMVETMKRIFGDRLIHAPIHDRERITLEDAMDKILIKVEYCRNPLHTQENQDQAEEVHDASSSDSSDDEETRKLRKQKQKKPAIIPELEELGVYTTSIKPIKDDFLSQADRAPKMVTNISESALSKLMKTRLPDIINHTSQYAMRVYPKGLRVMSRNLDPLPFWHAGSQIVALNFQKFDRGVQLNSALFTGTHGWVLKPAPIRSAGKEEHPEKGKKVHLKVEIKGVSALALPEDEKEIKAYCRVELDQFEGKSEQAQETKRIKHSHKDSPEDGPFWDETLKFDLIEQPLAFLRFSIKDDKSLRKDPDVAIAPLALDRAVLGEWRLIPMVNANGQETKSTLLVRITKKTGLMSKIF